MRFLDAPGRRRVGHPRAQRGAGDPEGLETASQELKARLRITIVSCQSGHPAKPHSSLRLLRTKTSARNPNIASTISQPSQSHRADGLLIYIKSHGRKRAGESVEEVGDKNIIAKLVAWRILVGTLIPYLAKTA